VADLTELQAAQAVKIAGSPNSGIEDNFAEVDANNNLKVIDTSAGPVTPGIVAANSSLTGGQFNTALPTLTNAQQSSIQLDSSGRLIVTNAPIDGFKATYSAAITDLATAALATDIFTITGSATKTVRITKLWFFTEQTTAALDDILLIKRSTANSAGTSTAPAKVPYDSNNAAATATVLAYTVNPTLGTTVGLMRSYNMEGSTGSGGQNVPVYLFEQFGDGPSQAIVLRGTGEVLAFNLNSITIAGSKFNISIEWTEE